MRNNPLGKICGQIWIGHWEHVDGRVAADDCWDCEQLKLSALRWESFWVMVVVSAAQVSMNYKWKSTKATDGLGGGEQLELAVLTCKSLGSVL